MALQLVPVTRVPVDVTPAGATGVTIENAGGRALRFVVGESNGEAAPVGNTGAGHLLRPGKRERVRLGGAGWPLWVWSAHPTTVAVTAVA